LTSTLRDMVNKGVDARQSKVAETAATRRAQREVLSKPPDFGTPVLRENFDSLPQAKQFISTENPDAFSIADGCLHINARANTFAYLSIPLDATAAGTAGTGGFMVKIRHGTDGGASWGPAAMLRWADGGYLRIGTRSDGTLQYDIPGHQAQTSQYEMTKWIWLRARWLDTHCVIECSTDGEAFEQLWGFDHPKAFVGLAAELMVGKVPFSGQPKDYPQLGPQGECDLEFVEVYGR